MQSISFYSINPYLLYGWLPVVLVISSISDLLCRRIPNLLTLSTIILAMLLYFLTGGIDGLLFSVYGFLLAFALFFIPYLAGGMGAGDVKLMGAVGAVLGWENTLVSLLFIALTGGVMSLFQLLRTKSLKDALLGIYASIFLLIGQRRITSLKQNKTRTVQTGIPYGVAIACGTCLFIVYMILANNTFRFLTTGT